MILESKTLARSILRRTRLIPVAHGIRMLWHRNDYEDRFAEIMLASVRPEDCVWDIGANVGYYTERFSRLAQHTVAFEPVPENCRQIESKKLTNVECHQIALGDSMGDIPMFVNGPLSSVARASSSGMRAQSVKMMRGDDLVSVRPPAVVKIDVEGYEQEVIRGMYRILGGVRSLFVEIHFQILEDRGMRQAPAAMVKDLNRIGFSKIDWPDASHLAAFRI